MVWRDRFVKIETVGCRWRKMEEPSSSGQLDSRTCKDILNWAKAHNRGSLEIICEYYRLQCPARGSTFTFHPLEHLNPLEFHRPGQTVLHIAGSAIDLRSCNTSIGMAERSDSVMMNESSGLLNDKETNSDENLLILDPLEDERELKRL